MIDCISNPKYEQSFGTVGHYSKLVLDVVGKDREIETKTGSKTKRESEQNTALQALHYLKCDTKM